MRFRLYYDGPLRPNQRDPMPNQTDKLASHKHKLRQCFHRQLKVLWETHPFLAQHKVHGPSHEEHGAQRLAGSAAGVWGHSGPDMIPLAQHVQTQHHEHGYEFIPLVRTNWHLRCAIHIVLLRCDPPGAAIHAGDIDNRVKTLIDGLRKPESPNELTGHETPSVDETPFYCLLQDDKLITEFSVETDRLLDREPAQGHNDAKQVRAVISVDIQPLEVTTFNLAFA